LSFTSSAPNRKVGLLCLLAAGVQSVFFRSYVATLTPIFTQEFQLTPQDIGALSSAFYTAYALCHLPAAIMFDRFGVGRVAGPLLIVGACATYGVSIATTPTALIVCQAFLGVGCSASFVGLFHYAARFHSSDRFVSLANLGSALGIAGGILASLPLSMFVGAFGWRAALVTAACAMLATAVLVCLTVRDEPSAAEGVPFDLSSVLDGLCRVILFKPLWPIFGVCLIIPAVPTFRTAWGGQYLSGVFGAGVDEIGIILLVSNVISFGIMAGGSFIPARFAPLQVIHTGIAATVVILLCFALLGSTSHVAAAVLFGLISVSGIPHMYLLGRARALLPANVLGLGLGLFGSVIFLGFGLMTTLVGWVLALAAGEGLSAAGAFAAAFLAIAAIVVLVTLRCPLAERHPKRMATPKTS
jgi:predicted MFS family arabinose efflux permease